MFIFFGWSTFWWLNSCFSTGYPSWHVDAGGSNIVWKDFFFISSLIFIAGKWDWKKNSFFHFAIQKQDLEFSQYFFFPSPTSPTCTNPVCVGRKENTSKMTQSSSEYFACRCIFLTCQQCCCQSYRRNKTGKSSSFSGSVWQHFLWPRQVLSAKNTSSIEKLWGFDSCLIMQQ